VVATVDRTGQLKNWYQYRPFGSILRRTVADGNEFEYTGKEREFELGMDLNYFGARYYDPVMRRFLAVDPLANKYAAWSPYTYTLDNPISLVDPDGAAPGDAFGTQNAAAEDFGNTYNDDSIRKNREYFSAIYAYRQGGKQYYTYEEPVVGGVAGVTPYYARDDRHYTAGAHTHAAYDPQYDNNNFSTKGGDEDYAKSVKVDLYVATPNGSLQLYDYQSGKVSLISSGMPSDPKDPNRQNTSSPIKNTADDETRGTWDKIVDFVVNLF
jgi:RHS repeat-associated protein